MNVSSDGIRPTQLDCLCDNMLIITQLNHKKY